MITRGGARADDGDSERGDYQCVGRASLRPAPCPELQQNISIEREAHEILNDGRQNEGGFRFTGSRLGLDMRLCVLEAGRYCIKDRAPWEFLPRNGRRALFRL